MSDASAEEIAELEQLLATKLTAEDIKLLFTDTVKGQMVEHGLVTAAAIEATEFDELRGLGFKFGAAKVLWKAFQGAARAGAGAGSGAGGAAAAAMEAKVDEILQAVKAQSEKQYSFSGAKTGKGEAVQAMLASFGLAAIVAGETPTKMPPGLARRHYTLHKWVTNPPDEEQETPALLGHFREQLKHLGVPLDEPQGFAVRDVRAQHKLSFRTELASGPIIFSGGTDAVVVPYGVVSWSLQARVIIDFKTPLSLDKPDACESQAVLELFGALHCSHYPPLVVCTDCVNFVIYQAYGRAVRRWHTFEPGEPGYVSADVAMRLISAFLLQCSRDPTFTFQDAAQSPDLSQNAAMLLRSVKRKLDGGDGLADRLSMVTALPEDERFAAAHDIMHEWSQHYFYHI